MAILRDGTDLTSANLQNALNSVRDRLNDVEEEDVRKHAFRRDHMPNLHDASGSGLFSTYWAGYNHDSGWDAAYNNQLHATGAGSWVGAAAAQPLLLTDPLVRNKRVGEFLPMTECLPVPPKLALLPRLA